MVDGQVKFSSSGEDLRATSATGQGKRTTTTTQTKIV